MSETINLPSLISRLATAAATDPADARRYLHHLFATIEQALKADGRVTVPGIGEFVASGDASAPVIFKADDQLAAVANEPFAAFSAVELNDGVTESVLDENATPAPATQPDPAYQPQPETILEPETEPDPIYEPKPVPEPEPQTEPEPEPTYEPEPQSEPEPACEPEPQSEPVIEEDEDEEVEEEEPYYGQYEHEQHDTGHGLWILLGLLLGLLIGLIGGFFAGKKWGANYADVDIVANSIEVNPTDVDETDVFKPLPSLDENAEATPDEISAQPQTPEPAKPQATPEKAKPQTTAEPVYDTISSTRYLTTMARDHYGKKNYWVFIYQANPQLKNPNTISPGTRILIPAYESFAGATTEETDAKARQLLNQLSNKYNL